MEVSERRGVGMLLLGWGGAAGWGYLNPAFSFKSIPQLVVVIVQHDNAGGQRNRHPG